MGTTLIIPLPNAQNQRQASETPHYIACLFTSLDYGKRVSPPEEILLNTRKALRDLARQVAEMRGSGEEIGNCHAVRINSGRFGVEWQKTKAVLEAGDLDITVVRPEEEGKIDGGGTAGDENLRQPSVKGERTSAGINARGRNPWASVEVKAESSLQKQLRGVKRKVEKDNDGDADGECANGAGQQPARLNPGIAKRRKQLGLDG